MAERPNCIIISDEDDDELNLLNANSETILPMQKSIPDEVIPDSEEDEPLISLPIIPPPHTPLRQRKQQQQHSDDIPSSPLSPLPTPEKKKKRKLLKDVSLPSVEIVRKKPRPSRETPRETDNSDPPRLSAEKPNSPSEIAMHTPKPHARPRPKPKAKPKKHKEGSNTSLNVQEPPLTPQPPPQLDREPSERSEAQTTLSSKENQTSHSLQIETPPLNETLKHKSSGKEKHHRAKENPTTQPLSKHVADDPSSSVNTFPPRKNNRPLTDILRNLNHSSPYTRRFSPAVSRNFLTRIAPLHPNRREPPPPPPRIIPKKTKKELEREERWEEELQDTIPNWCELAEEERQRYRKEKRDWELGLYED